MLAFERCTLTHSSGWAAVLAGLALALPDGLGLLLGLELPLGLLPVLVAMNASREAETVAVGELCDELCDDDGDAEPVWDGEPAGELDAADADEDADADADAGADEDADDDGEPEPALAFGLDGGGDTGVLLGVLPDDGAVGEAEADVDEPDGDGDGDFVGEEVGGGVGVDAPAAGSTAHLVSVFALAELLALAEALTLADVLALGEAAPAFTVPARAAPGQPASTPRVRNPPASRLSTTARTYARRMNIALSTLLIEVTVCSLWGSEATG